MPNLSNVNFNSDFRKTFPSQLIEFAEKVVSAFEGAVEYTPSSDKTETVIHTLHTSKVYTYYIKLKIKGPWGEEERNGKGASLLQATESVIEQWTDFFDREYPGYLSH